MSIDLRRSRTKPLLHSGRRLPVDLLLPAVKAREVPLFVPHDGFGGATVEFLDAGSRKAS